MRLVAAQINPFVGDSEGNTQKILASIERAKQGKADIVVFPELAICGYPPEDLLLHANFITKMEECLARIVKASQGIMVVVGVVRRNPEVGEKGLFNSAAICIDGKLAGFYDKMLLPTYDVFDERRYFDTGTTVPLWEYKGKKIAVFICEDIWQHSGFLTDVCYPCDPIDELKGKKPDIALNLSSSPYHYEKPDVRVKVAGATAKALGCPVLVACQVGGNDQLIFDGYSILVDQAGHLRHLGKGFCEDELWADLEALPHIHAFSYDPIEDLFRALVLGVRDYFHKQGFTKACLGLSGGIDSAIVACIGAAALGKENVLGIMMPSRYTSEESLKDARAIAKNLELPLWEISMDNLFQDALNLLEPKFKGMEPNVTEENMQARIRGLILMAVSNKFGSIVLSTGNKSEMAMGYCTLYGDMCGGLSVISDVTKTRVYELAHWLNRKKEVIPASCLTKPPSAELKANQRDTDTLPPYEIVDAVLQSYVEEYRAPEEIAKRHKIDLKLVLSLVRRIHRAEYKRRQAAPGIRVSKKAFAVGRRYPIVEGWM